MMIMMMIMTTMMMTMMTMTMRILWYMPGHPHWAEVCQAERVGCRARKLFKLHLSRDDYDDGGDDYYDDNGNDDDVNHSDADDGDGGYNHGGIW